MINYFDHIKENPSYFRQLSIDDQLVTEYNCALNAAKEHLWTTQGYFVYVIEGKKIWHAYDQAIELTPGKCIFVKKGAHVVEQFFDTRFCVVVFFVSDLFIKNTLRSSKVWSQSLRKENVPSLIRVDTDDTLHAFFNSVVPYFLRTKDINKPLLELKFKELILNVVSNPKNEDITSFFEGMLHDSFEDSTRTIMEENFRYNLGIEEFARMCNRSLSAFKRDFEEHFMTTPGRWLLEKRLQEAEFLLKSTSKPISDIAFETGFENLSHFSKTFKNKYGNSPANFRQSLLRPFKQRD